MCDTLIILSSSRVQITDTIDGLLATHRLIIGPRVSEPISGVVVVSVQDTGRQTTLLVRGSPATLSDEWQVIEPSLEEIVLAYLGNPGTDTGVGDARATSASDEESS